MQLKILKKSGRAITLSRPITNSIALACDIFFIHQIPGDSYILIRHGQPIRPWKSPREERKTRFT